MFERYVDSGKARETEGPWQHSGRYSEILFFNTRLQKQLGTFEFKPMVYLNSWSHYHPVTGRIGEADTNTFGSDLQINHAHLLFGIPGEAATGVSIRRDDQKTDYFQYRDVLTTGRRITSTLSDEKGALSEKQTRKADLYGIYFQETLTIRDRLICDVGIRFDQVKFDISGTTYSEYNYRTGAYVASEETYAIRTTYDSVSPRLGLVYKLTGGLNVYAAAAKGIKTPTESEINDNPDLKLPEIYNYETGLKVRSKKWSMDVAVYYSTEDDEVIQVIQEDSQADYVNAGRTIKKGAELAVTVKLPFHLNAGVNYSYTDYSFDKFLEPVRVGPAQVNMDRSGNFLPFVPTHQYTLILGFRHPGGYKFKAQSFYWGEYYMDNANTEKYSGYEFITNLMLGYERPRWEVNLMVDNLFDKKYSVETAKDTSGDKSYVPAAPVSVMANVVVKF